MMLKLGKYDLSVRWRPGKELVIPDHLSRSPQQELLSDEYQVFMALSHNQSDLQEIATKTAEVMDLVVNGWPDSAKQVSGNAQAYYHIRGELTLLNGIIFKADCIVIPNSLKQLH